MPAPGSLSTRTRAAVLRDDAVDGGEAEPGALARLLRREEGVEDPRAHLRAHAGAGVAHGEQRVAARGDPRVRRVARRPRRPCPVSIESVPPSGIASRALTARFISTWPICTGSATHRGQRRRRRARRRRSSSGSRATSIARVSSTSRRAGRRAASAAPACGRRPAAAARAPEPRSAAPITASSSGRAMWSGGELLGGGVGEADHREQDVVEVVGDPRRERADGLHLLGLQQQRVEAVALLLGARERGQVLDEHERLALPVLVDRDAGELPDDAPAAAAVERGGAEPEGHPLERPLDVAGPCPARMQPGKPPRKAPTNCSRG